MFNIPGNKASRRGILTLKEGLDLHKPATDRQSAPSGQGHRRSALLHIIACFSENCYIFCRIICFFFFGDLIQKPQSGFFTEKPRKIMRSPQKIAEGNKKKLTERRNVLYWKYMGRTASPGRTGSAAGRSPLCLGRYMPHLKIKMTGRDPS